MGFYINEWFLWEVLDKHNYILMGFNINECFLWEVLDDTQLYSNGIQY